MEFPKKISPKSMFRFELELMKESLKISGIEAESNEEILSSLNTRNIEQNKKPLNVPPLPCDYIKCDPDSKWMGHGFFYKSGEGKTNFDKDNSYFDYDSFDNYCRLTKCEVLLADYDLIREEFEIVKDFRNEDINRWLINQFGYISTGQIHRVRDGDLKEMICEDWVDCIDENDNKLGTRQRGGGRASTFFVDNKYEWDKKGRIIPSLGFADCKGNGTSEMQDPSPKPKACGFLSYVMALKGFVFEKAVRRALKKVGCDSWDTVHNYAIIDIGIRWKDFNPATGIENDIRNVIMIRKAHSRHSGRADEPVYYSIVQMSELRDTEQGKRLLKGFRDAGISSEQIPLVEQPLTWNVQCTATFDTLVDFSHWYFMPVIHTKNNNLLPSFRMSEESFRLCIQILGKYVFENPEKYPELMMIGYDTIDSKKAEEIFESKKKELQEKVVGKFGFVGEGKSRYSWSWMVELEDSEVYTVITRIGLYLNERLSMDQVKKWLD